MMNQTIRKTIEINASKEKVWEVLHDNKYIREWYSEFSEGSHAATDWMVGSKAVFTDNSKGGLIGRIVANQPNEIVSIEYEGIVKKGVEDYLSDEAQSIKGGHETYRLNTINDTTHLSIECDITPEYFELMSEAWDKALIRIKELAESGDAKS